MTIKINIEELIPTRLLYDECYKGGFDCAVNGATTDNCHFSYFSTPEKSARWEQGKEDGEDFMNENRV